MKKADLIIKNAAELLTCKETAQDLIGVVRGGWVAVCGDKIAAVGAKEDIEPLAGDTTQIIDADGKVVAPGFVDCHTHVVFGGSRGGEYLAKAEKLSDAEIAGLGIKTGITATMTPTREHSKEKLYAESSARVGEMIASGTTTLESKSGYGLDRDTEIKQLTVNKLFNERLPVDVVSTYLGAHGWPPEHKKEDYLHFLLEEMIPLIGAEGLADFCDVWCDEGHYDGTESRLILEKGLANGLKAKIHTGAYSYAGGADVAAGLGAVSADHLNYTPAASLEKLAKAGVTGVVLPGTDFAVKHPRPFDIEPMIQAGLEIALATNCCPGCWCTSMAFIIILACRNHGMSAARAIRGATIAGAKAIGKESIVGSIEPGKLADIQIWNLSNYGDIAYHYSPNPVDIVIKRGKIAARRGQLLI